MGRSLHVYYTVNQKPRQKSPRQVKSASFLREGLLQCYMGVLVAWLVGIRVSNSFELSPQLTQVSEYRFG